MEFSSIFEDDFVRDIELKFNQEQICPHVIRVPPAEGLEVDFMSGEKAYFGNVISPGTARDPIVRWSTDPSKLYMLGMVDTDAHRSKDVSRKEGQFVHWLVANIRGDCTAEGDTLVEYLPPDPSPGSKHCYVELLYEQEFPIGNEKVDNRKDFDIQKFTEEHGMRRPLAGNFFLARATGC